MKILIDMNLSPLWVQFLVAHRIDATHWSTVGKASAPDALILDYAAANGFVVFTHDLDFDALLAARKSRAPSVIPVRTQNVLPSEIGAATLRAIEVSRFHLEAGAIVTVDLAHHRVRALPV